jgi:plasmid maintenance system antidote protein VapI
MKLLGDISQGELSRASGGVSATTISLFLNGKRELRPAMEVRLIEGLERAFRQRGCRLDTAFFAADRSR